MTLIFESLLDGHIYKKFCAHGHVSIWTIRFGFLTAAVKINGAKLSIHQIFVVEREKIKLI